MGTGRGVSVMEVIKTFEKVTGEKVPYTLSFPREGDIVKAYANPEKIVKKIGWKSKLTLEDSLLSAWNWEKELQRNT